MNAPVQSNQKAQLLQNVVEHVDITSFDARPIIDAMGKMSFTSRDLARATAIYNQMLGGIGHPDRLPCETISRLRPHSAIGLFPYCMQALDRFGR